MAYFFTFWASGLLLYYHEAQKYILYPQGWVTQQPRHKALFQERLLSKGPPRPCLRAKQSLLDGFQKVLGVASADGCKFWLRSFMLHVGEYNMVRKDRR